MALWSREWTEEEVETLRVLYPIKSSRYVAVILKRTESAVTQMAYKLGLKKWSKGYSG